MLSRMDGRQVLVTGGTDGIGKEAARALAAAGAAVTLAGRDRDRGERARADIAAAAPAAEVSFISADVGRMDSVRSLAARYRKDHARLDVLIHSAGIIDLGRPTIEDGLERNFAVNYLGRFLLTALLDDLLQPGARVIALATASWQPIRFDLDGVTRGTGLSGFRAYQQSQAANDVWGLDLSERLAPRGVKVAIVAPGVVKTGIRRGSKAPWWLRALDAVASPFALTVGQGAETTVHLAADPAWPEDAVFFGAGMKPLKVSDKARDPAVRRALADASARLSRLAGTEGTASA